ncbi:hypothetical protein [Labrys miyagiensis]
MKYLLPMMLLASIPLSSCSSFRPQDVVQPSDVTIQHAMSDVADGLIGMKYKLKDKYKTGLEPDEVDITFNITAGATNKNDVTLDVGAKSPGPTVASVNASASNEQVATASRGNQITVKFKNVWTSDLNQVGLADNGIVLPTTTTKKTATKTDDNKDTSKPPTSPPQVVPGLTRCQKPHPPESCHSTLAPPLPRS